MAKKENVTKKRKKLPFAVFRKGALCALLGAGMLAGGLLVGCDETGVVPGPTNVNFYYGTENPNPENGKVGDFYIETDDGDVWQLKEDGWKVISNIKGPQGNPGASPVITISADGYWVINGIKTGNQAVGVKGDQGYYVTDVKEVVDDAWGISSHFEFTLNDDAKTVISTPVVVRLMPNHYYGATTGEEILELIELGAENIQIENDIELTSALAINHDLSIDLNNHKLTYTDGTQVVIDNGIMVEFKDGQWILLQNLALHLR